MSVKSDFDEIAANLKAAEYAQECYDDPYGGTDFKEGARWQHSQSQAQIEELQKENERLKLACVNAAEDVSRIGDNYKNQNILVCSLKDQIAIKDEALEQAKIIVDIYGAKDVSKQMQEALSGGPDESENSNSPD